MEKVVAPSGERDNEQHHSAARAPAGGFDAAVVFDRKVEGT